MVTSFHLGGIPSCPNCGDKTKRLKGDYFYCPSCQTLWEEKGWDSKIAREKTEMVEVKKLEGIDSPICIDDELRCDNCGKIIGRCYKYCVNHNEIISSVGYPYNDYAMIHAKRYCTVCSIKAGWLKHVRNTKTGDETIALFVLQNEEIIPWII